MTHILVWDFISEILMLFSGSFARNATFIWFSVAVIGMASRRDRLGVTSCIRSLGLCGDNYPKLLHLFRSSGWNLQELWKKWISIVTAKAPFYECNGHYVALMDGCKGSKEGFYMAGVQKIKQDSESQSKAEYIFGNFFGALALVASRGNSLSNLVAIPVMMTLQLGIAGMLKWLNDTPADDIQP